MEEKKGGGGQRVNEGLRSREERKEEREGEVVGAMMNHAQARHGPRYLRT